MNNLLERILFLEILEKIFRLKAFLSKAAVRATKPDLEVIRIFDTAIKEVLKSIETVFHKLHKDYGKLDEYERFSCMRRISDVFNSIDDLHSQLRFVYGEWTAPETYIFVKSLFKSLPEPHNNVSIVLSDSYMFEEVDLSRYLEFRLNHYNIPAELGEIRPTLFLPKIEYSNPLNWSILVHEMGHVLNKPLSEIFSGSEILEISTTADSIIMLENWTEEVWCDLIALKLLGPSYLASYITFSLLLASSGNIEGSSSTHPADRFRINIMKDYLEKMGIELKIQCDFTDFNNITDFFDNLFEDRCCFERENIILDLPPHSQFPINYHKFRDLLIDKIDGLTQDTITNLEIDNEKIRILTERLSSGILIGSSFGRQNPDALLGKLEELEKIIKNKDPRDKINNLMKELLCGVKEYPCNIGEIINAGWLYKCEKLYPKMIDLFFYNSSRMNDCLKIFQNDISLLDDKLKKSIEISYVHGLFSEEL